MRKVRIQTAQNISIEQNLAAITDRILAYILDLIIIFTFIFTVFYLYTKIPWFSNMSAWSFILVLGLPSFLYFPVIQYYNNGQSLGKKIMKLRIVKTDNTHPRLLDFIIRWLFRMIEISMIPGLALIFILSTKKKQRLGDIVAGTTVVSEKNSVHLSSSFLDEYETYTPLFKESMNLKEKDYKIIKEIFQNTHKNKQSLVFSQLRQKIEDLLNIKKPDQFNDQSFVERIIKDYEFYSLQQERF